MKYISLYEKFKKTQVHDLSGVIIIIDNRILLVNPQKYKTLGDKWSIPKGHVEGNTLKSALRELKEETGIELHKNYERVLKVKYKKNGILKNLTTYLYRLNQEDVEKYLKGWDIKKSQFDRDEIHKAKFFKFGKAYMKIEDHQRELLDNISNYLQE
jgi:8-oxo-dGTP pyrophosphatase MutT (NUDIX family)